VSETTSSRLLTLLSLLQGRRGLAGVRARGPARGLRPHVRRDVERLRALGYPVESMTGPAGGYQLRAGTAMPPLLLDDDEAIAIAVGLRTAAGGSVPGSRRPRCARWSSSSRSSLAPAPARAGAERRHADAARLRRPARRPADADAPRRRRAATTSACASPTPRATAPARSARAEPHSLVNAGRRWYLVACDCGRDDWRTFRVDRIEAPASSGVRFHPRELPAKDAAAYVSRSLQSYPSRYEARVTVECPASELQGRRWLGGDITPTRRAALRAAHLRRQPRLAGDADRDALRALHGPRAA
jgi:predicted DNA-binding transcriptional regulator YafY